MVSAADPYVRNLGFLDRSHYFIFQVAPQLYSRGRVDNVPDPPLLRKSGSAGNLTRDLWMCSQELWSLYHRGGHLMSGADLIENGAKQRRFHCKRVPSGDRISFPKWELGHKKKYHDISVTLGDKRPWYFTTGVFCALCSCVGRSQTVRRNNFRIRSQVAAHVQYLYGVWHMKNKRKKLFRRSLNEKST
jgi:hypothetical protein